MPAVLLTIETPVGNFTRTTNAPYKFATVWASNRAMVEAQHVRDGQRRARGVAARWAKDNGYGITWHFEQPTAKSYKWDPEATLVGVFPVKRPLAPAVKVAPRDDWMTRHEGRDD